MHQYQSLQMLASVFGLISDQSLRLLSLVSRFPRPTQTERILQNIMDTVVECQAVIATVADPSPAMLTKLQPLISDLKADIERLHELMHSDQWDLKEDFSSSDIIFFRVESLVLAFNSLNTFMELHGHLYSADHGISEEKQGEILARKASRGNPFNGLFESLRKRMEGEE